jgi:hypothetical protein
MIGGKAEAVKWWDHKGREQLTKQVQYGKAKASYKMQDGTGMHLIRFAGDDASAASMFLLKFIDQIQTHNLKEIENYV